MKRLLGDIRRADEDFHMIARGDRVAAVSYTHLPPAGKG